MQGVTKRIFNFTLIALAFHVNKVYDHQATKIAQA